MRQFLVLFDMILRATLRNRTALFFNFVSPALFYVIFGFIFNNSQTTTAGGAPAPGAPPISIALFLLPGVIVANQVATSLFGGTAVLVAWRERGIFRRIQTTPMPAWQLLLARIFTQLIVIAIQAGITVLVGLLVFQVHPDTGGLGWDALFIVAGALVFLALGHLIAARSRRVETANIIVNVLFLPLLFLSNLYIPIAIMPDWLQQIGKLLPSYLAVDLLRSSVVTGTTPANAAFDLIGLGIYFIVSAAIAARIFRFN